MALAAADHVKDIGKNGLSGHKGSDESTPFKRIARYGKANNGGGTSGENISFACDSAIEIVMQLFIDDGVKSRGHRKNMLNPAFKVTGISKGPH